MARYQLLHGAHRVGKTIHKEGEIIVSDKPLDTIFRNKFQRVDFSDLDAMKSRDELLEEAKREAAILRGEDPEAEAAAEAEVEPAAVEVEEAAKKVVVRRKKRTKK